MITNLLASVVVSLVTNVSERVPMTADLVECPDYKPGSAFHCAVAHYGPAYPIKDAKTKWVKTTIKEVTQLKFTFEDEERTIVVKELVKSEVEVELEIKRVESWTPVNTNETVWIYPPKWGWFTNYIINRTNR